jgi:hypothetical protein
MKRVLRLVLWTVLALLVGFNLYALFTGQTFVYKVLQYTLGKGKLGPDIHEFTKDPLATVAAARPQPIPLHRLYNQKRPEGQYNALNAATGTTAYLVLWKDSILYEEYFDGYGPDSASNSFSMAKSVVSLATGIVLQRGMIRSLDQPVGDFLPWMRSGNNAQLTIRHLLTMSSGMDFTEDYLNPFGFAAEALYGSDLQTLVQRYNVVRKPGVTFDYESGNTQLLAMVLEKATHMPLAEWVSKNLWQPMGAIHPAHWCLDHKGGQPRAFCCFNSNARDFSRFGTLLMHHGKWKGRSLVDSTYLAMASQPAPLLDQELNNAPNTRYGFQFWTLNYANDDVVYARGILGQYVLCLPRHNLVVVRLGHKRSPEKRNGHPVDIFTWMDAALELLPAKGQ